MSESNLSILLTDLAPDTALPAIRRLAAAAECAVLLGTIENGTSRISELIRVFKEYTYLGQAPTQNVDVAQSLETTLATLAHLLQPQIKLQRSFERTPICVNGSGIELNQVWTNLIQNAIDATSGNGELRLRTFCDGRFGVVEIADNGPGIPDAIRHHIFDPFFTTKGVGAGTGLGLSTVQTIVRKHGGHIVVSSEPGDTRFQVWLPRIELSE